MVLTPSQQALLDRIKSRKSGAADYAPDQYGGEFVGPLRSSGSSGSYDVEPQGIPVVRELGDFARGAARGVANIQNRPVRGAMEAVAAINEGVSGLPFYPDYAENLRPEEQGPPEPPVLHPIARGVLSGFGTVGALAIPGVRALGGVGAAGRVAAGASAAQKAAAAARGLVGPAVQFGALETGQEALGQAAGTREMSIQNILKAAGRGVASGAVMGAAGQIGHAIPGGPIAKTAYRGLAGAAGMTGAGEVARRIEGQPTTASDVAHDFTVGLLFEALLRSPQFARDFTGRLKSRGVKITPDVTKEQIVQDPVTMAVFAEMAQEPQYARTMADVEAWSAQNRPDRSDPMQDVASTYLTPERPPVQPIALLPERTTSMVQTRFGAVPREQYPVRGPVEINPQTNAPMAASPRITAPERRPVASGEEPAAIRAVDEASATEQDFRDVKSGKVLAEDDRFIVSYDGDQPGIGPQYTIFDRQGTHEKHLSTVYTEARLKELGVPIPKRTPPKSPPPEGGTPVPVTPAKPPTKPAGGSMLVKRTANYGAGNVYEIGLLKNGKVYLRSPSGAFPEAVDSSPKSWEPLSEKERETLRSHEGRKTKWSGAAYEAQYLEKNTDKVIAQGDELLSKHEQGVARHNEMRNRIDRAEELGFGVAQKDLSPGDIIEWAGDGTRYEYTGPNNKESGYGKPIGGFGEHSLGSLREYKIVEKSPSSSKQGFDLAAEAAAVMPKVPRSDVDAVAKVYEAAAETAGAREGISGQEWWAKQGLQFKKGAPLGKNGKPLYQVPEGYYSKAEKVLTDEIKGDRFSSASVRPMLENKGVKPREIDWMFGDLLDKPGTVTKQQLLDRIAENRDIEIETKTGGGVDFKVWQDHLDVAVSDAIEIYEEMATNFSDKKTLDRAMRGDGGIVESRIPDDVLDEHPEWNDLIKQYNEAVNEVNRLGGFDVQVERDLTEADAPPEYKTDTKYENYRAIPGGENYGELLITLPNIGTTEPIAKRGQFKIYDENGDLFSQGMMPISERTQREISDHPLWRVEYLNVNDINDARRKHTYSSSHWPDVKNPLVHVRFDVRMIDGKLTMFVHEMQSDWAREAREKGEGGGIPDNPFLKDWQRLTAKEVLKYAVDNGFDRVAWATGKDVAGMFDLRKHGDRLSWGGVKEHGLVEFTLYDGDRVVVEKSNVPLSDLESNIGKGPASEIRTAMDAGESYGDLTGQQLSVGGQWADNLYDRQFPSIFNEIGKKHGAKTGEARIGKDLIHSFDITPALRKTIQEVGQPLFQKRGASAAAKNAKGQFDFENGIPVIRALKNPDASTFIHEMAHFFRATFPFTRDEQDVLNRAAGAIRKGKNGVEEIVWGKKQEEWFSRAMERYLREGKAPTPKLESVFGQIKQFMRRLYEKIAGSEIDVKMSDEVRAVFDSMYGADRAEYLAERNARVNQIRAERRARWIELSEGGYYLPKQGIRKYDDQGRVLSGYREIADAVAGTKSAMRLNRKDGMTPAQWLERQAEMAQEDFGLEFSHDDVIEALRYEAGRTSKKMAKVFDAKHKPRLTELRDERYGDPTQKKAEGERPPFNQGSAPDEDAPFQRNRPKELVALHNLSAAKLAASEQLGGMALPSIAVTKADIPHEGYGEITLIGTRDLVDPKVRGNVTMRSDLYSPTYPQMRRAVSWQKIKEATGGRMSDDDAKTNAYNINNAYGTPDSELNYSNSAAKAFLESVGDTKGAASDDPLTAARSHGDKWYRWIDKVLDDATVSKRFFKGWTYTGRKRFADWTLDNIVKQMKSEMKDGQQGFAGAGKMRSVISPRFRGIEAIRKASKNLLSKEAATDTYDSLNERLSQIAQEYGVPSYRYKSENPFIVGDRFVDIISHGIKKGGLKKYAAEYGFDLSDEAVAEVYKFADDLMNAPTGYFESKPQRAVMLSEFPAAVIPRTASTETRDLLKRNGIQAFEYDPTTPGDRQRAVRAATKEENSTLFQANKRKQPETGNLFSPEEIKPEVGTGPIRRDYVSTRERIPMWEREAQVLREQERHYADVLQRQPGNAEAKAGLRETRLHLMKLNKKINDSRSDMFEGAKTPEQVSDIFDQPKETPKQSAASSMSDAESSARRFRPREAVQFEKPIVGPSGAKLLSYVWQWQPEEYTNERGEEKVRRISNWEQADESADTGRLIVHQFGVQMPNGETKLVSAESVMSLLGFTDAASKSHVKSIASAAKTLAQLKLKMAVLKDKQATYDEAMKSVSSMKKPSITVEADQEKNPAEILGEALEFKGGRHDRPVKVFRMGDVTYPQRGLSEYDKEMGGWSNYPDENLPRGPLGISAHVERKLAQRWEYARIKEYGLQPGHDFKYDVRELQNRIDRQERKIGLAAQHPPTTPISSSEKAPQETFKPKPETPQGNQPPSPSDRGFTFTQKVRSLKMSSDDSGYVDVVTEVLNSVTAKQVLHSEVRLVGPKKTPYRISVIDNGNGPFALVEEPVDQSGSSYERIFTKFVPVSTDKLSDVKSYSAVAKIASDLFNKYHRGGSGKEQKQGGSLFGPQTGAVRLPSMAEARDALTPAAREVADWFRNEFTFKQKAPTPPEEMPESVRQIIDALNSAKPIRGEQEVLYRKERARRLATIASIGQRNPGREGFHQQLGSLKGELPKAQFESIADRVTQETIDDLFIRVSQSKKITEWEKISAKTGLEKLLGAEGGVVPTKGELELLNEVFPKEFIQAMLDRRTTMEKLWSEAGEVLNLPRAIMASVDLSAPMRQGVFLAARNPRIFGRNFGRMFKYAFSERAYQGSLDEIASRPTYMKMRDSKLALTKAGDIPSKAEEAFMSNLAEKIPVFGHLVRGSNRAYSGFLTKLRADTFDHLYRAAQEAGRDVTDPKLTDSIAKFVNSATGRGDLGRLNNAAVVLNGLLFSPRLMASRLNLLNPAYYAKLDPFVRKEALKTLLTFAGTGMSILGLAYLAGANTSNDPRSADFGKIKVGNTRYDIWGGFQQYLVLAGRLLTSEIVSSTSGNVIRLGEGYRPTTRLDVAQRFVESKTAPIASFAIGLLRGRNQFGEPFKVTDEVKRRFIPMVYSDIEDLYNDPDTASLFMAAPGIFGVGVQTYTGTPPKSAKPSVSPSPPRPPHPPRQPQRPHIQ